MNKIVGSLQNLPEELILDNLFRLSIDDINELCRSNKKIKSVCDKNKEYIYRKLLERDFMIKLAPDSKNAKLLYNSLITFSNELPVDYIVDENPDFMLLNSKLHPDVIFDIINDSEPKLVKKLLVANPDIIDLVDKDKNTLLHYILKSNIIEQSKLIMINELLDINQKKVLNMLDSLNKDNQTALILFSKHIRDQINTLIKFISQSKNINQQDKDGNTALIYYLKSPNPAELVYLEFIKRKADITLVNKKGNTAFTYAIKSGNYTIIRDLFDKYFKNHLNHKNTKGEIYLHKAAKYFQVDAIELLLSKDSSLVNEQNYEKNTPLHAVSWQDSDLLETIPVNAILNTYESLIINGGDLNIQNKTGITPFMNFVSHFNSIDKVTFRNILNIMIENRANFDLKDENGYNILHYFFTNVPTDYDTFEFLDNLEELLAKLLDKHIYSLDKEGNTALFWLMKKIYSNRKTEDPNNIELDEFFNQILLIFKENNYDFSKKDRKGRTIKTFLLSNLDNFNLESLN